MVENASTVASIRCRTTGAVDALQRVAAKFAFGHGFNQVIRKLGAQQVFKFELLHFALQLLRFLLGLLFELFNLLLHRRNGQVFFRDLQPHAVSGISPGLRAYSAQTALHTLFNRQLELAFGIVEFTLLFDQLSLRFLRFGLNSSSLCGFITRLLNLPAHGLIKGADGGWLGLSQPG